MFAGCMVALSCVITVTHRVDTRRHYSTLRQRNRKWFGRVFICVCVNRQRHGLRPPCFYLLPKPRLHRRARACVCACVRPRALACTGFLNTVLCTGVPRGGVWGVNPPTPKFRSVAKAGPKSQFRGIYICHTLSRIRVSLIYKLSETPN
jgi:hypothetical protein